VTIDTSPFMVTLMFTCLLLTLPIQLRKVYPEAGKIC
jgi:hypothetical protein